MEPEISVIIVSYNAHDLLAECLDSVAQVAEIDGVSVETIVVDNASADGSADYVRAGWPDVVVIDADHNGGFAYANNIGMLRARGAFFLLLNSDARLLPGSLKAMAAELARADDIGLVGPKLLNPDHTLQRSIRGFPTPWRLATEFWYLRRLAPRSRLFNAFYAGGNPHDMPCTVDWVMGACVLVSRAAVDAVGLMNESYFMYSEETEWQHAMHAAGLRARFTPHAEVIHIGGGTARRNWGPMYLMQVTNHVRVIAMTRGVSTARRVRRQIAAALRLRSLLYRLAALVPGRNGEADRERSRGFAEARSQLAGIDIDSLLVTLRPAWPATKSPALPMNR